MGAGEAEGLLGSRSPRDGAWRRPARSPIFWLAILSALAYLPCVLNGWVNWDDDTNFLTNPDFQGLSWSHLKWAWATMLLDVYQPLAWLILEAEYSLWGMAAWGYHLASVVFHAGVVVLLYRTTIEVLRRVGGAFDETSVRLGSFLAALLFAVHPLRVEVVAWVSCQPYLPCAFFYLLAVLAYLRAHPEGGPWKPWWAVLTFVAAAAAMLSKAVAVTVPLALLVLDFYPLRRLNSVRPTIAATLEKVPFFVLALLFVVQAIRARGVTDELVPTAGVHLSVRLMKACFGLAFYAAKTFWPASLSAYHPPPPSLEWTKGPFLVALIFVAVMSGLALLLIRRWPGLAAVWAAYVALLLPHLGLTGNDTKLVAERYSYVATFPWVILLAYGLSRLVVSRPVRWSAIGIVVALSLALGVVSWRQCAVWGSSETLFLQALNNEGPDDPLLLVNLGAEFLERGSMESAERCFRGALRNDPNHFGAQHNLGLVLVRKGKDREALEHFRESTRLEPRFAEAHYNLAETLARLGQLTESAAEYNTALKLDPEFTAARLGLARVKVKNNDLKGAETEYRGVLKAQPALATAHAALGTLLARQGRLEEAVASLRRAVTIEPGLADAQANLGLALSELGRTREAETAFRAALRVNPNHPNARRGLAGLRRRPAVLNAP